MSKSRKKRITSQLSKAVFSPIQSKEIRTARFSILILLRRHIWLTAIIAVLAFGAFGAGLTYLKDDADVQQKLDPKDRSVISRVNPFITVPSPTPQLQKSYVYAGQKLLAVVDENAPEAPPADLAIWRPSTGVWWVLGGPGSAQTSYPWGHTDPNADRPVPGDYDGDGKTDFATFEPSTGNWWIVPSSTGSYYATAFGNSSDILAQADYDGDGKTDIAVFRPSTGVWFIYQSSNSQTLQVTFGASGDIPAPADHDGDGKADVAVWRGSNLTFYAYRSSDAQLQQATFTGYSSGDKPVSADYDGDGKADFALLSGNNWVILNSATSTPSVTIWQVAGDIAVQNDYDGDGKCDIAVWRPSNGHWYIRNSGSSGALREENWGIAGDIPVPAYYRR